MAGRIASMCERVLLGVILFLIEIGIRICQVIFGLCEKIEGVFDGIERGERR